MKKFRLRTPFRILFFLIIVVLIVILYFPVSNVWKLMKLDYSLESSLTIYKQGLHEEILEKEYSEVLDRYIKDPEFNWDKLDIYMNIKYLDRFDFLSNVNKMLELKYNVEEINQIYEKVSDDFLTSVILKEYVYDIVKYLNVDIFKEENFYRYKAYFNGNYNKTVLYVNIGLDKKYYTDTDETDTFSTTILVNKYHGVSKDFVVPNMVKVDSECSNGDNYLQSEAADAFVKMCKAAKKEGYVVLANYTYRDFNTQQNIWDQYLKLYGQSYNDKYVTLPGFSEHHTGLAVDVKSGFFDVFKKSNEYKWMIENSYKYGYIHRYQSSKESITGIAEEAWHFRYVGVDVATYMYENKLSFEEYYALFLDK